MRKGDAIGKGGGLKTLYRGVFALYCKDIFFQTILHVFIVPIARHPKSWIKDFLIATRKQKRHPSLWGTTGKSVQCLVFPEFGAFDGCLQRKPAFGELIYCYAVNDGFATNAGAFVTGLCRGIGLTAEGPAIIDEVV